MIHAAHAWSARLISTRWAGSDDHMAWRPSFQSTSCLPFLSRLLSFSPLQSCSTPDAECIGHAGWCCSGARVSCDADAGPAPFAAPSSVHSGWSKVFTRSSWEGLVSKNLTLSSRLWSACRLCKIPSAASFPLDAPEPTGSSSFHRSRGQLGRDCGLAPHAVLGCPRLCLGRSDQRGLRA